jgi:hypothetical protein
MKPRKTAPPPAKDGQKMTVSVDTGKEVRAIARERLGAVKPTREIPPKDSRKKPKHKKQLAEE